MILTLAATNQAQPKNTLEKYLILNHYMNNLFGVSSFMEFRKVLEDVEDGYGEDGHSYIYYRLLSLKGLSEKVRKKLSEYDFNIKTYLDHINKKRDTKITLKYFQYLAVLFTEIYLDFYFQDPKEFNSQLTQFGQNFREKYDNNLEITVFKPSNMRTLAFWMATGSGKTIIMHINYLQFLKYNKGKNKINFENIILVTPNSGLTKQHMDELQKSDISCAYFLDSNESTWSDLPPIKVIEITKFTEEKKGEGTSIDIKSVTRKNIVFADEAHKGSRGDEWKKFRERLSEEGFRFEYSATFGQALYKIDPEDHLLQAYAKSIIFDYSYKYFYTDGYGKDYKIINTKKLNSEEQFKFLLANALQFYEQLKVYQDNALGGIFRNTYNIERPLWVFIGGRVKIGKESKDNINIISDILKIIEFFQKFLSDKEWAQNTITQILKGESGILNREGHDVFAEGYPYLNANSFLATQIYEDMKKEIFKTSGTGNLYLAKIKNAEGEIGLKVGAFGKYFGVINIGEEESFLKSLKEHYKDEGVIVESDEISSSIFEELDRSNVDVLIGARKFLEGWNSWRVSSMGLIHMGKTEGPLIIQLFGRGIRLKGYLKSLKRSSAIGSVTHPKYINVLETLNIFGIEANYMEIFREYLEREGVPTEPVREFELPTKLHDVLDNNNYQKLYLLKFAGNNAFKKNVIELRKEQNIRIELDLRPRASEITSRQEAPLSQQNPQIFKIEQKYLELLNWDYIYSELISLKYEMGWCNLIIKKENLKEILQPNNNEFVYNVYIPEPNYTPIKIDDLSYLEDLAVSILKSYARKYYELKKAEYEKLNFNIDPIKKDDEIIVDKYILKIKESDLNKFNNLIEILNRRTFDQIYHEFNNGIKNVYIDEHLYQPLLKDHPEITIVPQGLNEGEENFIEKLREYLNSVRNKIRSKIYIYVLRNRTRGKGIGFFEHYTFYPDFIIWIIKNTEQHILFVEPHGLAHISERDRDKINLYSNIKEYEKRLNEIRANKNVNEKITLDSYIVSVSEYDDIKGIFNENKSELENKHILFEADKDLIKKILEPYI